MKNHPKGLPYLFFTEMWERFGYYLMIGIFLLYMTDTERGGWAWADEKGTDMFGTFIACAYLTPFIGGALADRLLGYRNAIILGGILMGIGYLMLAIKIEWVFYLALVVMVLGNGLFKPNISILLGNLYNEPKYQDLKDTGYNIFYMGINIGAFICNFFAAYLRNNYSWGAAFAAAGIGMFIGVIVFIVGRKHYAHADVKKITTGPKQESLGVFFSRVLLPGLMLGTIGWFIKGTGKDANICGSDSTDAFFCFMIPVFAYYANVLFTAPKEEKRPIAALLAIYVVVIAFWAVFKQNGTALTLWAKNYTDREMPTTVAPFLQSIKLEEKATYALGEFPIIDNQFRRTEKDGKPIKTISYPPYFHNIAQKPAEGKTLSLISTELYQSVNPFFIIVFTPLVIWFFSWLRRRKREPTTPSKLVWGLGISAASNLMMVWACFACHNGLEKSSSWFLIGTYAIVTFGELCLSPMGLSLVSKLAPVRIAGLMMGGWQLATAFGNKLSGLMAQMWNTYDEKANFFWVNIALLTFATLLMLLLLRWLNGIFKEKGLV